MTPSQPTPEPGENELSALFDKLLNSPSDPDIAQALQAMGISGVDPSMVSLMSSQLRALLNTDPSDPLNIETSTTVARSTVAVGGDAVVGSDERHQVEEAVRVASMWVDDACTFPAASTVSRAYSRAEWVEATMPVWAALVAPVATGMTDAMTGALRSQWNRLGDVGLESLPGLPPGVNPAALMGQMEPMLRSMSSALFATSCGQAVGQLAGEVVSGTDVGLPLVPHGDVVLLPANIKAFGAGLDLDLAEIRLFLAVRETARTRLFAAVPWLASHVLAAVTAYAQGITIDTDHIESQLSSIDINDPERMQELMSSGIFAPTTTAAQHQALAQLETVLALVEGWVEVVTEQATQGRLPHSAALVESVRRRRAVGGPAEHTFATLVGLHLRPRRLRDAANLFRALEQATSKERRDSTWDHPDVCPTTADLDDLLGYVDKATRPAPAPDELDEALARMLNEANSADHGSSDDPSGERDSP